MDDLTLTGNDVDDLINRLRAKLDERQNKKSEIERRINDFNLELVALDTDARNFENAIESLQRESGNHNGFKQENFLERKDAESSEEKLSSEEKKTAEPAPSISPTQFVLDFIKSKGAEGATYEEIFSAYVEAGFSNERKGLNKLLRRQEKEVVEKKIKKIDGKYYYIENDKKNLF